MSLIGEAVDKIKEDVTEVGILLGIFFAGLIIMLFGFFWLGLAVLMYAFYRFLPGEKEILEKAEAEREERAARRRRRQRRVELEEERKEETDERERLLGGKFIPR